MEQENEGENDIEESPKEEIITPELISNDIPSIIRNNDSSSKSAPLWLITFTDVMALMLTFFVLLYAMTIPEVEKWEAISVSLSSKFKDEGSRFYKSGSQDAVSIDKISKSKALDLSYLKVLVTNLLKSKNIENVFIFQNNNRLIISLPSELLFESGQANVNLKGKKALFALGGALSRVKNRIEIVGHTDPKPINKSAGLYKTNWELSLARSSSVAAILKEVGYNRDITVKGVSSARYDELSEDISMDKRYDLSRRVDIILMDDAGFRAKLYSLQ